MLQALLFAVLAIVSDSSLANLSSLEGLVVIATEKNQNETKVQFMDPKTGTIHDVVFETSTLPKGHLTYHWSSEANIDRWNRQGHMDAGEADFLRQPTGTLQVYGAGIYVSESSINSSNFGESLAVFEMPEDTNMITRVKSGYSKIANNLTPAEMEVLKSAGIHGHFATTNTGGSWWVFTNEIPLRVARRATAWDFAKSQDLKNMNIDDYLNNEKLMRLFPIGSHPDLPGGNLFKKISDPSISRALFTPDEKKLLFKLMLSKNETISSNAKRFVNQFSDLEIVNHLMRSNQCTEIDCLFKFESLTGRRPSIDNNFNLFYFNDLLHEKPLSNNTRLKLKQYLERNRYKMPENLHPKTRRKIVSELRDEALNYFKNFNDRFPQEAQWNIGAIDLTPENNLGDNKIKGPSNATFDSKNGLVGDFGRDLLEATEFIDMHDLRSQALQGAANPWQAYDQAGEPSLLDRWRQAASANSLENIHATLNPNGVQGFRSRPIKGGGDGKGSGTASVYYRITEKQKTVLESNPLLSVEVIEDTQSPLSPSGEKQYLARHSYPSIDNYQKFRDQLSADLVQRLDNATANGPTRIDSKQYFALTQEIVTELTHKTINDQKLSPIEKYQRLVSIHPFDDYNGRSLRKYYQNITGQPLLMDNFDEDLFLTPEEMTSKIYAAQARRTSLTKAMEAEFKKNPDFPKFYDLPEMWNDIGIASTDPILSKYNRAEEVRKFYQRPDVQKMIREKDFIVLGNLLEKDLHNFVGKLPDAERRRFILDSVLRTRSSLNDYSPQDFKKFMGDIEILSRTPANADIVSEWMASQLQYSLSTDARRQSLELFDRFPKVLREKVIVDSILKGFNAELVSSIPIAESIGIKKEMLKRDPKYFDVFLKQYAENRSPEILDLLFEHISSNETERFKFRFLAQLSQENNDPVLRERLAKSVKDADPKMREDFLDQALAHGGWQNEYNPYLVEMYLNPKNRYDNKAEGRLFRILENEELALDDPLVKSILAKTEEILESGKTLPISMMKVLNKIEEKQPKIVKQFKSEIDKIQTQANEKNIIEARKQTKDNIDLLSKLKKVATQKPEEIVKAIELLDLKLLQNDPTLQKLVAHYLLHQDARVFDAAFKKLQNIPYSPKASKFIFNRMQKLHMQGFPDSSRVSPHDIWRLSNNHLGRSKLEDLKGVGWLFERFGPGDFDRRSKRTPLAKCKSTFAKWGERALFAAPVAIPIVGAGFGAYILNEDFSSSINNGVESVGNFIRDLRNIGTPEEESW